ncbi:hypothetical protein WR25_18582 [Diploscapter pachys]|uniref:Uncharacterized protein n=1 Tax=Diploscapter pachys TaxID=2018661 RepID=A0A2A2K8J2_9BILA|nr:hypothetical protein WR25_18582 [Diploscapter pachys]
MSNANRRRGNRDTAKDIILGLAPSGPPPRQPKEGAASLKKGHTRGDARSTSTGNRKIQAVRPTVIVERRTTDNSALNKLQYQLNDLQRQNRDLLSAEQAARKRLEANQNELHRRLISSEPGVGARDLDDLRRQVATVDGKLISVSNDLNALRSAIDRQVHDLMAINNEVKSRPVVDPNKIANSNQVLDGKVRDLHTQIMQLKQALDHEKTDRAKEASTLNNNIARLQDIIRQQEQSRVDILNSLSKKGDVDKDKLSEETRRLNDRITLITNEVTKNLMETQQRMKDDMMNKYNTLEAALRAQNEAMNDMERDGKRKFEERLRIQGEQLEALGKQMQARTNDRNYRKERFGKVNEALAALEQHLEIGNKKMDKLMSSEVNARRLHEKGLLAKMTEIEDKLNNHFGNLNKAVDDAKAGKENIKVPSLDIDDLRREMEAIAADKNKLSMEGLLKLEEKMSKVQQDLNHDKKDLAGRLSTLGGDSDGVNKLRAQVNKLDEVQEDMDKAQDRVRDKVERQIPQDLNELSAKADNIKHQLNSRIDKEEEERYMAIKELQEAVSQMQTSGAMGSGKDAGPMKKDVEECKIAIKKLAESVTTVKNVLDKKIQDETRKKWNLIPMNGLFISLADVVHRHFRSVAICKEKASDIHNSFTQPSEIGWQQTRLFFVPPSP